MDDGVRSKQIVFDDNKWDFIDLSRIFDELPVLEYFIKNKGVKYDLLGTLGFILGPTQRDNKLFCSEFCMSALGFKEAWRLSPNASFQVLLWKLNQLGDVIKTVNNGNYNYRLLPAR